jgi:Fe-S oxidoreductase
VGAVGQHFQADTVAAAIRLLEATGETVVSIGCGRESPYLANSLGLFDEAKALAQATLDEIASVGAKRVFVMSPGDVYTFDTLLQFLGIAKPAGVDIEEVSDFLAQQLEKRRISFKTNNLSDYAFFDPDQTVRVPDRWQAPRKLLAAVSQNPPVELFWRKERAAPCGSSGGLPFTQPSLSAKLAEARLDEAQKRGIKTLITDDPQTLHHLRQHNKRDIVVESLFELLAAHL